MTKQEDREKQSLERYREAAEGHVEQTAMVPVTQVQDIVTAAVKAALEAGAARPGPVAKRAVPGRDAEDDIRIVLRTADFLLRACGIKLHGNMVTRGDGAFFSDPSMVEAYRMIKQLLTAYGVTSEPVEFVKRPESPESFTDEFGVTHRTPLADPYDNEDVLDNLEGGWGRR